MDDDLKQGETIWSAKLEVGQESTRTSFSA